MIRRYCALIPLLAVSIGSSVSAKMDFKCDATGNRDSKISNASSEELAISGVVSFAERKDHNLPLVGLQLLSTDKKRGTGFNLKLPSDNAPNFDIIFVTRNGDEDTFSTIGSVSLKKPIPFRITVSATGLVEMAIGDEIFSEKFYPLPHGQENVFCSAGAFRFDDLKFGDEALSQRIDGSSVAPAKSNAG